MSARALPDAIGRVVALVTIAVEQTPGFTPQPGEWISYPQRLTQLLQSAAVQRSLRAGDGYLDRRLGHLMDDVTDLPQVLGGAHLEAPAWIAYYRERAANARRNRLVEIRKKAGVTQAQFAERLGVTRDAVASWETGRSAAGEGLVEAAEKLVAGGAAAA